MAPGTLACEDGTHDGCDWIYVTHPLTPILKWEAHTHRNGETLKKKKKKTVYIETPI